ncbi:MAG: hypothetical protein QOE48_1447 [Mycobacterium sp.]|jgi:hypothetical protein|uniref:hypothetical protein n=1 Tax=Mycobacterium sp. TaxID=1785 RepID=UPI0028B458E1|nr:hypothetical protein [Mycobacterium sp.]MDT5305777.1 hypothetical protein [Mycobacterium sp.]
MNNDLTVVEVAQQLIIDAELLDQSPVRHAETIKAVAELIQQPAPDLIAGHRLCRLLPCPHPFGCARGDGQRVAAEQHDGRRAGLPAQRAVDAQCTMPAIDAEFVGEPRDG